MNTRSNPLSTECIAVLIQICTRDQLLRIRKWGELRDRFVLNSDKINVFDSWKVSVGKNAI